MSILSAIEQVIPMLRARTWHAGVSLRLDDAIAGEVQEALERARVVGVLDAYAARSHYSLDYRLIQEGGVYTLAVGAGKAFRADSPDAARAAAAKAIESGEV